jgi:hypothetical protein
MRDAEVEFVQPAASVFAFHRPTDVAHRAGKAAFAIVGLFGSQVEQVAPRLKNRCCARN